MTHTHVSPVKGTPIDLPMWNIETGLSRTLYFAGTHGEVINQAACGVEFKISAKKTT